MYHSFSEWVYDTLEGQLVDQCRVPGVENAFEPGKPCLELYGQALDAYWRVCERLGVPFEDDDIEIIFNAFLDISRIMGHKMYDYGVKFGISADSDCWKQSWLEKYSFLEYFNTEK